MNKKHAKYCLTAVFKPSKWLKALLGSGVTVVFTPAKELLKLINGGTV